MSLFFNNDCLVATGLSYPQWLEMLIASYGAYHWLGELTSPRNEAVSQHFHDNFDRVAHVLGFDPKPFLATVAAPYVETLGNGD